MLIVLNPEITQNQKNHILSLLREGGAIVREITDAGQSVIGATGSIFVGVLADADLFHESFVALGLLTLVAAALFATLE